MLKLENIVKDYGQGESTVRALKGVSLEFRNNEFVSILGQSGCGKTTMLNIIGGLDQYTEGDLQIDGTSTKEYKSVDWDTYRNKKVGFIFQSYNLISHTSILSNVEMALTLSGISAKGRKEKAAKALEAVGLGKMLNKKPNQLSGGQMQRVSIARALINNPEIILADEPTGALDSATSIQIMDLLKEIAKDRLVIMVTHNPELAKQYSTRIIKLNDGEIISDSNPLTEEEEAAELEEIRQRKEAFEATFPTEKERKKAKKRALKKTSMSFWTALKLSFNNLKTKKGRTIMTAIAGSIGIVGVGLVMAISNGMTGYINDMQQDVLSKYPISISRMDVDSNQFMKIFMGGTSDTSKKPKFPDSDNLYPYNPFTQYQDMIINNNITQDYVDYMNELSKKDCVESVRYGYGIDLNVIGKVKPTMFEGNEVYRKVATKTSQLEAMFTSIMDLGASKKSAPNIGLQEIPGSKEYILNQYDLVSGTYPEKMTDVVLVIDSSNQLAEAMLASLGLSYASNSKFEDVHNIKLKVATNNAMFIKEGNAYHAKNIEEVYNNPDTNAVIPLDVVGILRPKKGATIQVLSNGIAHTSALTQYMLEDSMKSNIVKDQIANPEIDVFTGKPFNTNVNAAFGGDQLTNALLKIGGINLPTSIAIYPRDFEGKEEVIQYLKAWNGSSKITYNDMSQFATDMMSETVNIITIALVCFAAVSLVVSSVMIGIITYVSVVERTKEIGILRSLGARKIDICNVFNAETTIIGFSAGVLGVALTYILSFPINLIIKQFVNVGNLAFLNPLHGLILVIVSMVLTIIAGLIPSYIASKKDAVIALRTD